MISKSGNSFCWLFFFITKILVGSKQYKLASSVIGFEINGIVPVRVQGSSVTFSVPLNTRFFY